jgi:hypothetical protein
VSLSFLFRRNAELCTTMARFANSAEMRDQWTELAKQWQRKAETDELVTGGASSSAQASDGPGPVQLEAPLEQQPAHLASLSSTLVPLQAPIEATRSEPLAPSTVAGDFDGLDDFWRQVIVDIRSKRSQ